MAVGNAMFTIFRNKQLGSTGAFIDLDTDTLRLVFVDEGGYTPNLTTHDFYDDITAATFNPTTRGTGAAIGTPTILFMQQLGADSFQVGLVFAWTFLLTPVQVLATAYFGMVAPGPPVSRLPEAS